MPDYSQNLSGLNYGPEGNPFTPFGDYGPHYNIRPTNPIGVGTVPGVTLNPNYQDLNWEATMRAGAKSRAGGGFGSAGSAAVLDPVTGLFVHPTSRQPYTGMDATGRTYSSGRPSGEPVPYYPGLTINPNDPNQRYQAANIIKSPEIAGETNKLLDTFTRTASSALQDFGQYLNNFKGQIGTAATRSAAATDIGPLAATLRGQQGRYANELNRISGDYAALNPAIAANLERIRLDAHGLLPEYNEAADRIAGLQYADASKAVRAATGRNLGSYEERLLAAERARVQAPMELAKIQQGYNVLSQFDTPFALDAANRETARIANFDPMIAAQQFQTGQATEQTIQQLAMVTANMGYDNAVKYMQALSVPWEVQQRILSGQIGQLGGLSQLYSGARYQGLQDLLGANVTPSIPTYFTSPGFPSATPYRGPNYGLPGENAPQQVSPDPSPVFDYLRGTDPARWQQIDRLRVTDPARYALLARYEAARSGGRVPGSLPPDTSSNPMGLAYPRINQSTGTPQNLVYDPDTGGYYDRYTGSFSPASVLPGESGYNAPSERIGSDEAARRTAAMNAAIGALAY